MPDIEIARKFFNAVLEQVDSYLDDTIYELVDPDFIHPNLCDKLNFETIGEVVRLGFKAKYGEELKPEGGAE